MSRTTDQRPPIKPPGYHFQAVSSNNEMNCLIPLFAGNPRAYYTPAVLDATHAKIEAIKAALKAAALDECLPDN